MTIWRTIRYPESMAQFATHRRSAVPRIPHPNTSTSKARSLGLKAPDANSLIQQVEQGFSFATLRTFEARSGIAVSDLAAVVGIPERTLARRRASGKLTWDESDRLLRVSLVFDKAVDLFEGDVAAATAWLLTGRKALRNRTPLAYLRTEAGAREVEDLIGRLEHGIFS